MMGTKFKSTGSKSSTLARVEKMKVKAPLCPLKPRKPAETCYPIGLRWAPSPGLMGCINLI